MSFKKGISRRSFCENSMLGTAGFALPWKLAEREEDNGLSVFAGPEIIDTHIQLFDYPFRNLKYSRTSDLVNKLNRHKITKAWACSFEALFHKNMDLVNQRIFEECNSKGNNLLEPVGSINTTWPDWEEDLRRCKDNYGMKIIRIFPIYQMIQLSDPAFLKLVELASGYGMLIQIVGDVEDPRHHHPLVTVRNIDFEPLIDVCEKFPDARIQLLHWNRSVNRNLLERLNLETNVTFDISRIEGAGEVGGYIHGDSFYGPKSGIAADRILFGSHAPYFPVESALLKLMESPLDDNELVAIMRGNAERIFTNKN